MREGICVDRPAVRKASSDRLLGPIAMAAILTLAAGLAACAPSGQRPADAGLSASAFSGDLVAAKEYKNCTVLNKHYPHGVGKPGAVDHVSGSTQRVTNFHRSKPLYKANKKSDRDGDGIACEKL